MKSLRIILVWGIALALSACGGGLDTTSGIDVTIDASPEQGAGPLLVTFKAVLSGYEGDTQGLSYTWDFGDGDTSTVAEPSHTFAEEGSYTVTLNVTDGELTGKAVKEIKVGPLGPGIDLRIDTVDVTPTTINPGGAITIKVAATNAGSDAATGTVMVRMFIVAGDTWPTTPPNPSGVINIPGLQGGETVEVAGEAYVPSGFNAGSYYVFAYIDGPSPDTVSETNEDNNIARSELPINVTSGTLPIDINVVDITTDLTGPIAAGDDFTVTATLANDGTQDSSSFKVAFRLSVDPIIESSSDQPLGMLVSVPTVAAGGTAQVTETFTVNMGLDNRPYYLGVISDANGDVAELDETNNVGLSADLVEVTGASGCTEDMYEPNEQLADAITLTEGTHTGLMVCPNSVEWYRVDLAAGDRLTATTTFNNGDGNIDAELYEEGVATPVAVSNGMGNSEVVTSGLATAAKTYYVALTVGSTASGVAYDLDLAIAHSGGNGRDLVAADVTVTPDSIAAGTDVDVAYKVYNFGDTDIATGTMTRVWLSEDTTVDAVADVMLGELNVNAINSGEFENIALTATVPFDTMPNNYYVLIVVDADDAVVETYEDNNEAIRPLAVGIGCAEDSFEDNDDSASAASVSAGDFPSRLCPDDDDWYAVEVQDGVQLDFDIAFEHDLGDIDMKLFDSNMAQLDSSTSTADGESVSYTNTSGQTRTYFVQVYYYSGTTPDDAGSDVALSVSGAISSIVDLTASNVTIAPDTASEGDGVNVTWTMHNLSTQDATAFDVDIRLSVDQNIDGADMVVRTEPIAMLAAGDTATMTRKFTVPAGAVGGTWYVGVYMDAGGALQEASETNNGKAAPTTLTVLDPCADDMYEDNDTASQAAGLNLNTSYNGLVICTGDVDWFAVTSGANATLTVDLSFIHADGDLDLKVYENDGITLIGASAGVSDAEQVSFMASSGTTYKIFVKGFNGAANTYTLQATQ